MQAHDRPPETLKILPDLNPEILGGSSLRRYIIDTTRRDHLTIRQTCQRVLPSVGSSHFKGTPTQVAGEMEDGFETAACDGFALLTPLQPSNLFHKDYGSITLPTPPSVWRPTS